MGVVRFNMQAFLFVVFISLSIMSCSDIIETDIRKSTVNILAPSQGAVTPILRQTFAWAAVTGAEKYHLQCVFNSFDSATVFVFDTTITNTKYSYTLTPGKYQWRVQAVNNGYTGPYTNPAISFVIDTSSNLGIQTITLVSPANGAYSNLNIQTLAWDNISVADSFIIQVSTTNFASNGYFLQRKIAKNGAGSTTDTVIVDLAQNTYQWRVQGKNSSSYTPFSSVWSFIIQQTAPAAPTLVSPINNTTVATTVTSFSWTRNATDVAFDSLYVYRSDSITIVSGFPKQITSTSYQTSTLQNDSTFYWRVKSTDKAGNTGSFPTKAKFNISY
jgi:hypothetical protein